MLGCPVTKIRGSLKGVHRRVNKSLVIQSAWKIATAQDPRLSAILKAKWAQIQTEDMDCMASAPCNCSWNTRYETCKFCKWWSKPNDHHSTWGVRWTVDYHGWTTATPAEVNCYVDASIPLEQQLLGPTLAGLGIYIPKLQNPAQSALLIKAQAQDACSPLQAEALATQLAIQLMTTLHQQRCNFFSDSEQLVKTLQDENPMKKPAHWRIRPTIAEIVNNSASQPNEFCKIPRQLNKKVHKLAKHARQTVSSSCAFSCQN